MLYNDDFSSNVSPRTRAHEIDEHARKAAREQAAWLAAYRSAVAPRRANPLHRSLTQLLAILRIF